MSEENRMKLILTSPCIELVPSKQKTDLRIEFTMFLDTEVIRRNSKITTQVYNKIKKLPVDWTSKIQVRYKHNVIR